MKVFVSHSHRDKERFVDALVKGLRGKGINVWYDTSDLRIGEPFWERIGEAVCDAEYAAVVLSKEQHWLVRRI
jgi:hypothetical protein